MKRIMKKDIVNRKYLHMQLLLVWVLSEPGFCVEEHFRHGLLHCNHISCSWHLGEKEGRKHKSNSTIQNSVNSFLWWAIHKIEGKWKLHVTSERPGKAPPRPLYIEDRPLHGQLGVLPSFPFYTSSFRKNLAHNHEHGGEFLHVSPENVM